MIRSSSGIVAGLAAVALAVIGFLTYQASAYAPADLSAPRAAESLPATTSKAPRDKNHPTALPGGSGTGQRVVYSLDDDRVWLVDEGDRVRLTFRVSPGTVDPLPARYVVTSRSGTIVGSDGVAVEHVVRFASLDGIAIGFSAAVDGSVTPPDPARKLGAIREPRGAGAAMWDFATIGTRITVIN
ncbi:hypothetical protein C6Y14_42150 [Streptomyces dioscori]|uniref:L,D-transpeptidase n=1 Tax=Streptomyces dioscori TaxID=2109333 RepID=A0A2P8PU01_9ACTN|nr:hypothetical protein [Streptomyces dioscori]PSM37506.1 hypothetical protein C6Y14_42150 [Streptomyces dioscori]